LSINFGRKTAKAAKGGEKRKKKAEPEKIPVDIRQMQAYNKNNPFAERPAKKKYRCFFEAKRRNK
jgi:hypothetical protein